MKIGMIGPGKVGTSLGKYLLLHGFPVAGYYGHHGLAAREAADFTGTQQFDSLGELVTACDVLFLTVPDRAIASVWEEVRQLRPTGKIICHCSGSISSAVFEGIDECGAFGCSAHPLLAISDRFHSYQEFSNAFFTIEGSVKAQEAIRSMLAACGNRVQAIDPSVKTVYHAAAVMASNLMVGLMLSAGRLLESCGFTQETAASALAPLASGNLQAVLEKGPVQALTGPIERNDALTVRKHLDVLSGNEKEIYRTLSAAVLAAARRKHPDRDYRELEEILQ